MFKILITLSALVSVALSQPDLWKKCGGEGYEGPKICSSGLQCNVINQWHHQCEPSKGGSSGGSAPSSPSSGSSGSSAPSSASSSSFVDGTFKHGISFDGAVSDEFYKKHDYISIWINTIDDKKSTDFNPWYQGEMIKKCIALGKTPLFYAYVIAFEARAKAGLQDCDVDPKNNLCHKGSKFIKDNRAYLVSRYQHQSAAIAKALGDKNKPVIFVMEPDFWQFYGDHTQEGGTLSGEYMRALFDDFAAAIKANLPNAKISWDISAWIGQEGFKKWWSFFASSKYIDFIHTSGGQAHGSNPSIKPSELPWKFVHQTTGKKIIADCGYGVAGGASSNCAQWNLESKKARIADGVFALSAGVGAINSQPPSYDRVKV